MTDSELGEGDCCPECNEGILEIPTVVDCTCHTGVAPCHRCIENPLTCTYCGYEVES